MTAPRPRIKRQRPERELRNAIIAVLRAHGIAAWPTGVGAHRASYNGKMRFVRTGTKGMSDIIGVVPWCPGMLERPASQCEWPAPNGHTGRFLAIEVKNATGTVSPEQTAFLQTVVRAGGIGFVARSCADVIDKLNLTPRPLAPGGAG